MVSCNIVPKTLHCSVSFARKIYFAVHAFIREVIKPFTSAIGGASQLLSQVAIVTDTPPPFRR